MDVSDTQASSPFPFWWCSMKRFFDPRGFEQILKFLGGTILPAAKDASVSQFYDTRIIERLKR
jgi:hypothetical protein